MVDSSIPYLWASASSQQSGPHSFWHKVKQQTSTAATCCIKLEPLPPWYSLCLMRAQPDTTPFEHTESLPSYPETKAALLQFYFPASVIRSECERAPSSDTSQPTQQISPDTAHPLHPAQKKSVLKVIWMNNVPIFLLAFQNTANFLSLVQPTESLRRSL